MASWPAARAPHWRALLVARAIETQAFVLGVNRVGRGGGLDYRGDSLLVGPLGEIRADLPPGHEGTVGGEVDAAEVAAVRERFPFRRDRREDLYRTW